MTKQAALMKVQGLVNSLNMHENILFSQSWSHPEYMAPMEGYEFDTSPYDIENLKLIFKFFNQFPCVYRTKPKNNDTSTRACWNYTYDIETSDGWTLAYDIYIFKYGINQELL